jgi:ERCC4-type nuclease
MPVKVARLNPAGVKHNAAAELHRNVTDALSSRYIAEYMISHPGKVDYNKQNDYYAAFRSLHKYILMLKKQNTQLINQLKMTLYSAFPEMMCFCKDGVPNWVLEVLKKYPSAESLAKAQAKTLAKIKSVTMEKAEKLIEKAKNSVASRTNVVEEFLISNLARQIQEKQHQIEEHKNFLIEQCKGQEVTLLKSIKGIGDYSAAAIMIEIEDIKRFASAKHLSSYFGVHPELKQSGDKLAYRMSKKGRSSMRAILYMPAQTALLHDEHFKAIYHSNRSKGMSHKQAVGVIMHKLLRVIFGILSSKQPYNVETDKKNQQRNQCMVEKQQEELKIKRRFQSMDEDAPISRIQNKKRKAHVESQVPVNGKQVRDHQQELIANI